MARAMRNLPAMQDFARRMDKLSRQHKGDVRIQAIGYQAYARFGIELSPQTVRNAFESKVDPTACSVELLIALADYFEVEPAALGPYAEGRIRSVLAYAGGPEGGPGLDIAASRCTVLQAA